MLTLGEKIKLQEKQNQENNKESEFYHTQAIETKKKNKVVTLAMVRMQVELDAMKEKLNLA